MIKLRLLLARLVIAEEKCCWAEMQQSDGRSSGGQESALVTVRLPPLRQSSAAGPGSAHRLSHDRPPTPPPRPESSLSPPPPPHSSSPSSGPGRGLQSVVDTTPLQLPASLSSLETPITLTSPRNVSSRAQNLYVDTPFKGSRAGGGVGGGGLRHHATVPGAGVKTGRSRPLTHSTVSLLPPNSISVITAQPPSSPKTVPDNNEKLDLVSSITSPGQSPASDSIICVVCGRCRCTACATPKPLPQVWLCDNSCLCSAPSIVDTVSCMCCVKGAWYHCGERLDQDSDQDDTGWIDSPCSCSHNKWWVLTSPNY